MDFSVLLLVLCFASATRSSIVLDNDNGYSNIVVAIAKNVPQPQDGGTAIVNSIKVTA